MAGAPGLQEEDQLRAGGFAESDIQSWRSQTAQQLSNAGFSGEEVNNYFGIQEPNLGKTKDMIQANLDAWKASQAEKAASQSPATDGLPQKPADTLLEAIEAGFQMSVSGLVARGRNPEMILPEHAPMFHRIAQSFGTIAGDLPAMVPGLAVGSLAGGAAGSAIPGLGTGVGAAVGGPAGAMALPAALRTALMEHYEKGDIKDFEDFWERTSSIFLETLKSGAIGAATGGAGAAAGKVIAGAAIPAAAQSATVLGSEIATMTTVGKALEGETPKASDFVEAAILVGGLHASGTVAGKLRNIYAKTGLKPAEVAERVAADPVVKQELLSSNIEIPKSLEALKDPDAKPVVQVEAAKPVETPASATSPTEKILSQIGEKPKAETKIPTFDDFYKNFVDRLDPIKKFEDAALQGKKLPEDQAPYALSRMANDAPAKAKHFIERGVLDFKTLENRGKSLSEITQPFNKELPELTAYLVSKRAVELEARGIKTGFDSEAAAEVVAKGGKFEKAAKEITEFQNGVLQYLSDSGVVSKESLALIKEANRSYVPFARIFEEAEAGGKAKSSPLKKIKGSDRKIQDPFVSILENTESLIQIAEKNRAVDALVKLDESLGEGRIFKKAKTVQAPIEIKSAEMAKLLEGLGMESVDAAALADTATIFRPKSQPLADNQFEVRRNGKREVYEAEPAVAEAVKALDGDAGATNLFMKFARGITTAKKIGISLTPDFILRNIFRDQLTAGVFSKGGGVPFVDVFTAMGDILKKREPYYNWLKSGGANGAFLDLNSRYLENEVFKYAKETGITERALNVVKKPIEMLEVAGQLAESATRLAEFKRVSEGAGSGSKVFKGGFSAREVTVDFQRMGAKMSALNAITAFQNVAIQGLDRTARAFKEDPAGVAKRAAAAITVPSVLLWWANKDDPRYKEIPRWQKDLFWIVMTDKTIYRIPKPQELGMVFGTIPERMLESFFTDNPRALKDFNESMGQLLVPSFIPDVVSAPVEHYYNRNNFTGNPIIPRSLEGIMPEYQYTDYTSESAKVLGKAIRILPTMGKPGDLSSPMVLDHYIEAWSGTLGKYAVQLSDQALVKSGLVPDPVKPAATLADIPFVKAFVARYPSATAQSIQDFYDRYQENKVVLDTLQYLQRSGDFAAYQKELRSSQNQSKMLKLNDIQEALREQQKFIRNVYKNPSFKPEEKRQFIDQTYLLMIELAKQGNAVMDQYEKAISGRE